MVEPQKSLAREHGVSEATIYNWKSNYGCMKASDVKKLKDLEEENSRLKKMYADVAIDNQILKDLLAGPSHKKVVNTRAGA